MSIEQLMQIDVTLAARRPDPIATAPTAISVVTGDDIRRAGATTLADAVALADGVHVARFNNGTWSVTARGFAAVAGNKMLVMIDARTARTATAASSRRTTSRRSSIETSSAMCTSSSWTTRRMPAS